MKKVLSYILACVFFASAGIAVAAPTFRIERTILPETTDTYDLGSAVKEWLTGYFGTICLSGDCKSAWPTGGGGTGDSVWSRLLRGSLGIIYNPTTTDVVLIGSTATNSLSRLEVNGGATIYGTATTSNVVATSTNATSSFTQTSAGTSTIDSRLVVNGRSYYAGTINTSMTGDQITFQTNSAKIGSTNGSINFNTSFTGKSVAFVNSTSQQGFTYLFDSFNLGLGTTSPYAKLSVVGEVVATNYTATGTPTSTFPVLASATGTISWLNGTTYVDGYSYPKTCAGIQSAINRSATGTTIFLPPGVYDCAAGGALSFMGKSQRLIGAGASTTIIRANGVTGGIIYDYFSTDTDPSKRSGIEIAGITFDVNNTSNISAIQIASSENLNIHDIRVVNNQDIWAVLLGSIGGVLGSETEADYDASASKGLKFNDNEVAYSRFGTNEGVLCVNCRNYQINGNYFHDNTQGPAALAVYVGSKNGVISGNVFSSSTIKSFYSSGVDGYVFSNNITTQATGTISGGIQVFNTKNATIENNILNGTNNGSSANGGISIYDYSVKLDGHNMLDWATTTDIHIRNNEINNFYYGVQMGAVSGGDKHYEKSNIFIERNTFSNGLWSAIQIGTSGSSANDSTQNIKNVHIIGNTEVGPNSVFDVGVINITGSTTNPNLVRDIFVYDNKATRSLAGSNSAGINISGVNSLRYGNNHVEGTAKGTWSDIQIGTESTSTIGQLVDVRTGFSFSATTTFTGGTSTFSNGIILLNGCVFMNGACLTSGSSFAWPYTPSTNFGVNTQSTSTPAQYTTGVFASGTSQFVNLNAYGRLGVGTSSPDSGVSINNYVGRALLHVGDDTTNDSRDRLLVENRWTDNGSASLRIQRSATTPHFFVGGAGTSAFGTTSPYARLTVWGTGATNATKNIEFVNSASTTLGYIQNDGTVYLLGSVGIGTTSPYAKLSVVGKGVFETIDATSTTATSTFSGGFSLGGLFSTTGDIFFGGSSKNTYVKVGTNQAYGTSTLSGGTVTVSNTLIKADSLVYLTACVEGGTRGSLSVGTRVAGTSFVINSTNVLDTSTVCYEIKQPSY